MVDIALTPLEKNFKAIVLFQKILTLMITSVTQAQGGRSALERTLTKLPLRSIVFLIICPFFPTKKPISAEGK